MNDKKSNDNRWKEFLLKSSLPLEQLVSEKLELQGLYVVGEYPYTRYNEQNMQTEFSVDLHAFKFLGLENTAGSWGTLEFLIECKYNHPGVKWIFLPQHEDSLVIGYIHYIQELSNRYIEDTSPLYKLDHELPYCGKGIELNSSGFDPNSISRGLYQLRYGLPHVIAHAVGNQVGSWGDDFVGIAFFCMVLVTTADLYVLKQGLDLETYLSAKSIEDISTQTDALIVFQETGPHLSEYYGGIAQKLHEEHPEIKQMLKEAKALLHPKDKLFVPPTHTFDSKVAPEHTRIVVVHLNALDDILERIEDSIIAIKKHAKKFATFVVNQQTGTRHLTATREVQK